MLGHLLYTDSTKLRTALIFLIWVILTVWKQNHFNLQLPWPSTRLLPYCQGPQALVCTRELAALFPQCWSSLELDPLAPVRTGQLNTGHWHSRWTISTHCGTWQKGEVSHRAEGAVAPGGKDLMLRCSWVEQQNYLHPLQTMDTNCDQHLTTSAGWTWQYTSVGCL